MTDGVRITIYCDEDDRVDHKPLVRRVVELLWSKRAAGVTVLHGDEGFGLSRHLHTARHIELAAHRPVLIEWVDTAERFEEVWPELQELVRDVVVTRERLEVVHSPDRAET